MNHIFHSLLLCILTLSLAKCSADEQEVIAALQRADYYAEKACEVESELCDWLYERYVVGETDVNDAAWNSVVCHKLDKAAQFARMARREIEEVLPADNKKIGRSDFWEQVFFIYRDLDPKYIEQIKDSYKSEYHIAILGEECSFLQMYLVVVRNSYKRIMNKRLDLDNMLKDSK